MADQPPAGIVTPRRRQKIAEAAASRQYGMLILEDVHDPHNAEAVFRTCEALAIQHVGLIFDTQEPFDPYRYGKATSSSANKWLDFHIYRSTGEALAAVRAQGYEIVGTVISERAESIYEANLTSPRIALLLGNEHRGLSRQAIEMADRHITIPMSGMVQSLNLSVTAAICLYEISRQRQAAGIERYLLSTEERDRLARAFLHR